jgi:hypothetical protein
LEATTSAFALPEKGENWFCLRWAFGSPILRFESETSVGREIWLSRLSRAIGRLVDGGLGDVTVGTPTKTRLFTLFKRDAKAGILSFSRPKRLLGRVESREAARELVVYESEADSENGEVPADRLALDHHAELIETEDGAELSIRERGGGKHWLIVVKSGPDDFKELLAALTAATAVGFRTLTRPLVPMTQPRYDETRDEGEGSSIPVLRQDQGQERGAVGLSVRMSDTEDAFGFSRRVFAQVHFVYGSPDYRKNQGMIVLYKDQAESASQETVPLDLLHLDHRTECYIFLNRLEAEFREFGGVEHWTLAFDSEADLHRITTAVHLAASRHLVAALPAAPLLTTTTTTVGLAASAKWKEAGDIFFSKRWVRLVGGYVHVYADTASEKAGAAALASLSCDEWVEYTVKESTVEIRSRNAVAQWVIEFRTEAVAARISEYLWLHTTVGASQDLLSSPIV